MEYKYYILKNTHLVQDIEMVEGGVACARQGDLDTYCLVFLGESVVWTRLGYFLDEWYHIEFES